jgi:DNA mismatch repair ATPase MutS
VANGAAALAARARELLTDFESGRKGSATSAPKAAQRDLFEVHPALEALRALQPDRLTPMAALQALDDLKKKL